MMMKMEIKQIEVDKLLAYEKNNKKHPQKQIDLIVKSIKEFGFKNPILIDKKNIIIAGHGRCEAAKIIGMKEVPCIRCDDLTPSQVKAYRLADNKLAELAEWDFDNIKFELEELQLEGFDIELTGFDMLDENIDFEDWQLDTPEKNKEKNDNAKKCKCPACGFEF